VSIARHLPYADFIRTTVLFLKRFSLGNEQTRILSHYLAGSLFEENSDELHLQATMAWLARAQDQCCGDGVSNVFFFRDGWGVAYPETSGYIVATFLAYANHCGDQSYFERALKIGDWEIAIQTPSGGILSNPERSEVRVFNTGQVMLGWCALFNATFEKKYLDAAIRAGDYLLKGQEKDGSWQHDTYCGARTYHARVDWALLTLAKLSGGARFAHGAMRNLEWVLSRQNSLGWFDDCGFDSDLPITHVIEYTLGGLLGCYSVAQNTVESLGLLEAVELAAEHLCAAINKYPVGGTPGMIPAAFDHNWQASTRNSCLTGNSQVACLLYRLAHLSGNSTYRTYADRILSATKRTQLLDTNFEDLRGAVAGSFPISHGYVPNGFPNWAAKFFADALLMKINFNQKLDLAA